MLDYRVGDAARTGNSKLVLRLIDELSTDPVSRIEYAYQALISATEAGQINILEALRDEGFSLNITVPRGSNALERAAIAGNIDSVRFLLNDGLNIDHDAAFVLAAGTTIEVVRCLLATKLNINGRDEFGRTALIYAAIKGKDDIADLLICNGADVTAIDQNGYDALRYAAVRKNNRLVDRLTGVSVNSKHDGFS